MQYPLSRDRQSIPWDDLKRLGIPPPPEGRYMSRFEVSFLLPSAPSNIYLASQLVHANDAKTVTGHSFDTNDCSSLTLNLLFNIYVSFNCPISIDISFS